MDVSHYDGTIDWTKAHTAGIDFAFVKATEGTTFTDPMFATNWAAMKAAGVVRGAYHFFHSNMDPVAQADFVTTTVGTLEPGDLPIVIDLEVTDGNSEATVASTAKTFLDAVTKSTGITAMIYTSPSFLSDFSTFAGNPLWVANWGVMCPDVPSPWSTWTFWQNSSTGTVSGVSGASAVDLDYFNGTPAQLTALGVGGSTDASTDAGAPPPDAATTADSGGSPKDSGTAPPADAGSRDAGAASGDAGKIIDRSGDGGNGNGGGGGGGSSFGHRSEGGCTIAVGKAGGNGWALTLLLLPVLAAGARRRDRGRH
jgi:lysozyme